MMGLDAAEFGPAGLLAATLVVMFVAYGARVVVAGRALDPRVQRERATPLLGAFPMEAGHWALRVVGKMIADLKVSPDAITWASLTLTATTVPLAAVGYFSWAALLLAAGAACDALDGIVARRQRSSSDSGEVLDAVVDRYADAMPLAGLALYYRGNLAALSAILAALIGSMLVSYVRAKAEALQVSLPGGSMRRHERVVYVGLALVLGPFLPIPWISARRPATVVIVAFVAISSNIAAIVLTRKSRQLLVAEGRGPHSES
jgi:CDP-diacylglycerol--glycerol-3-phosphate 3-phosphatidyltransferase